MSRSIILSLATAATIAVAGLASSTVDARGFGGGGLGGARSMGGNHFLSSRSSGHTTLAKFSTGRGGRIGHPGHPGKPGHPGHWAHHHHHHWIFRDGIWLDIDGGVDDVIDEPVVATPGLCTCLTKTYTRDGLVVFADVCTKEAASARIDGLDATELAPADRKASDVTPVPPADGKAADASQAPTSTNYAGRTYKDFLAANQAAQKN
jgi:hypothetical protein